ncbi:hypothetical protein [Gillisia limnaea]|uniref:Uncharacterized protein n=1 Tax=Gillisia limnaea (strain DSM 15749 / LMG 21470 / R-8282) TaxID=865937 RepID=H2BQU1_GILLR|nr:hypothetical protein [Gillisia limnaea]EHQ04260.1 hypothetical protein Gilli_0102 [Gillisia limnaea DSM 15749]
MKKIDFKDLTPSAIKEGVGFDYEEKALQFLSSAASQGLKKYTRACRPRSKKVTIDDQQTTANASLINLAAKKVIEVIYF